MSEDPRRSIPRTDTLLADPPFVAAAERLGRPVVRAAIVAAQQRARAGEIPPVEVAGVALASLPTRASSLTPVLNATGVVVHTKLAAAVGTNRPAQ